MLKKHIRHFFFVFLHLVTIRIANLLHFTYMEEYIVSARKYRPASFDTVVGQRALTTTLLNAIRTNKLAHAYLFCGPRGVGKTTCARIFAKTINCTNPNENGEACNECESCRSFDEGRSMNIHEMDGASNNSVEDIRELIQQVQIPPQTGRYKVFIIDEVHMLSTQAFNAFLKTLEEPPSYVIFVMATTEKHKILPTILSRCQVYDFARMTLQNTVDHLKYVAQKEGYTTDDEALNLIAQKADGGMRDALSIFDQMVSFTGGNITYQKTLENLNILDSEYYFRLVDHFLAHEVEPCLLILNEIIQKGFDPGIFIGGLAAHLRDLMVSRDPQTLELLEVTDNMRQRYQEQAVKCQPKFLYRAIKLCNDCDQNYRTSRNKRLQVEICLIQAAQDDDATAGRSPKTLKPLFNALKAQPEEQQNAVSVNASQTANSHVEASTASQTANSYVEASTASQDAGNQAGTNVTSPTASSSGSSQKNEQKTNGAMKLKTVRMGSFSNMILHKNEAGTKQSPQLNTVTQETTAPKLELNEHDLNMYWHQAANKLPKEYAAYSQRMLDMLPEIVDSTRFKVVVNNQQVKDDLQRIMPMILSHIRSQFNNTDIDAVVDVATFQSVNKIFTKPEILKRMMEQSPNFKKLVEELNLELD